MRRRGGTLEVTGGVIGGWQITIDGGGGPQVDSLLGNSETVTFATSPAPEALILARRSLVPMASRWTTGRTATRSLSATASS